MNSGTSSKAFTQNWLQSLTLVAQEPAARQIKPLIDTVSDLSRMNTEADRVASARKLWDFAATENLLNLLAIIPLQQPTWYFDRDDPFVFTRTGQVDSVNFDPWTEHIGIAPGEVSLSAEVTSRDWLSLVRQEAVRLQQSMNTSAFPQGMNLKLGCKATWDLQSWAVRFDDAPWVVVRYDEPFSVQRPTMDDIDECLSWSIATANEQLLPKVVAPCTTVTSDQQWRTCAPRFQSLHQRVLEKDAKDYSAWFRKVWACVWTVVYREQGILRGQADIDVIRRDLAACITNVPRMTTWMFVFARLVCECQLSRGLGILGDYAEIPD